MNARLLREAEVQKREAREVRLRLEAAVSAAERRADKEEERVLAEERVSQVIHPNPNPGPNPNANHNPLSKCSE